MRHTVTPPCCPLLSSRQGTGTGTMPWRTRTQTKTSAVLEHADTPAAPCVPPPFHPRQGYGTGIMPWRDENSPPIEDYIDDPLDNPEDDAVLGRGRANVAAAIKSLNYSP